MGKNVRHGKSWCGCKSCETRDEDGNLREAPKTGKEGSWGGGRDIFSLVSGALGVGHARILPRSHLSHRTSQGDVAPI